MTEEAHAARLGRTLGSIAGTIAGCAIIIAILSLSFCAGVRYGEIRMYEARQENPND